MLRCFIEHDVIKSHTYVDLTFGQLKTPLLICNMFTVNTVYEYLIEESSSHWRAQVLITKNNNHMKRMVIDYSQTINRFTTMDAYPLPNIDDLVLE